MKIFQTFLLVAITSVALKSSAQNFAFVNDTVSDWGAPGNYLSAETNVVNYTGSTITLRFKSILFNVPSLWNLTYCGSWCGTSPLDTIELTLSPSSSQFIRIKGFSGAVPDSATIVIIVYEPSNPAVTDTCVYKYYTSISAGISELTSNPIQAYPNPAGDFITVQLQKDFDNTLIEIFDSQGKKIKEEKLKGINNNYRISVTDLPQGKYFIQYKDNDGNYLSTPFVKVN